MTQVLDCKLLEKNVYGYTRTVNVLFCNTNWHAAPCWHQSSLPPWEGCLPADTLFGNGRPQAVSRNSLGKDSSSPPGSRESLYFCKRKSSVKGSSKRWEKPFKEPNCAGYYPDNVPSQFTSASCLFLIYYYGLIFLADCWTFPLQNHIQVLLAPSILMTAVTVLAPLELHLTLSTFWGAISSPGVFRKGCGQNLPEILRMDSKNIVNISYSIKGHSSFGSQQNT